MVTPSSACGLLINILRARGRSVMSYRIIITAVCFVSCSTNTKTTTIPARVASTDALAETEIAQDIAPHSSQADRREANDTDTFRDSKDTQEPQFLEPEQYCELAAAVFCPYYVRCGRMAVNTESECLAAFIPACNSRFEPTYIAVARRGSLKLSNAGLSACKAHLADVPCEKQIFDLDLGCADMWVGTGPEGAPCGPGIESFVCATGTTCVLGTSLCGTCQSTAPNGTFCDADNQARCEKNAHCYNGVCVARPGGGEPCEPSGVPCVLGTSCVEGNAGYTCMGRPWAAPGEACGQQAQCQYKSECIGGICAHTSLVGEPCENQSCAAGYCANTNTCQEMQDEGEPCSSPIQCRTSVCASGACGPRITTCLE